MSNPKNTGFWFVIDNLQAHVNELKRQVAHGVVLTQDELNELADLSASLKIILAGK